MKRILILAGLVIILINQNVIGQEKGTEFGIKAGINYSNFILEKDVPLYFLSRFNGKIGFHAGGFLRLMLSDKFSLKPELLYSTQGAEYEHILTILPIGTNENPLNSNIYKVDIKENLFLLPIMLDYYFSENFDIEFGPQLGYLISKNTTDNNDILEYGVENNDSIEIGLNIGLGYTFAKNYRFGIRFNYVIMERNDQRGYVIQFGFHHKI